MPELWSKAINIDNFVLIALHLENWIIKMQIAAPKAIKGNIVPLEINNEA